MLTYCQIITLGMRWSSPFNIEELHIFQQIQNPLYCITSLQLQIDRHLTMYRGLPRPCRYLCVFLCRSWSRSTLVCVWRGMSWGKREISWLTRGSTDRCHVFTLRSATSCCSGVWNCVYLSTPPPFQLPFSSLTWFSHSPVLFFLHLYQKRKRIVWRRLHHWGEL